MTKAKISEYSATANDNTDVNGINIAEGCPPSSMNNMGREIMAALKRFQVGSDGDGVTVGGSLVVSGSTTANTFSATQITASGAVITSAGTAAAPAIVPTGDTNTGIFFPAADTIAFAEGGAEAMRIDSSGRVGIGTSSPSTRLDVRQNTSADLQLQLYNTNAGVYASAIKLNTDNATGSRYNAIQSYNGATAQWQIGGGGSDSTIVFGTGSSLTERARFTSDGYLRMASGSGGIQFNGDTAAANALDDYEEGTWTPSFTGSTTNPTVSYSTQTGKYTKIGRLVTVSFVLIASGTPSGGSGDLQISGLPFAVSTTSSQAHGFIGIMNNIGINMSTNQVGLLTQSDAATSLTVIATSGTVTSSTSVQAVAVIHNSGARVDGTFIYMT